MPFVYDYERPALTVDCVVFGLDDADLKVALIRRALPPFEDSWALPGGFVQSDETLETAARRELLEETGIENAYLEQLFTFGNPGRDPRGWTVTVAYYALVNLRDHAVAGATDAKEAAWFSLEALPPLAFDHADILAAATARLRGKVRYQPVGFELLPEKFTLFQLQRLYEIILGRALDKRNFRAKILEMGILRETGEMQTGVRHRAARLYRFDTSAYQAKVREGFSFEI